MSTHDRVGAGQGFTRRQALSCLATWTGAAVVWTVAGVEYIYADRETEDGPKVI
jgi:hypothetical protein